MSQQRDCTLPRRSTATKTSDHRKTDVSRSVSKGVPSTFNYVGVSLCVFGAVILGTMLLFRHEESQVRLVKPRTFCCPDILRRLFATVNRSIDPCRSIFTHTCALVAEQHSESLNTDPVEGFPITEAGRAVAAYYRACVTFNRTGKMTLGKASATALLKASRPPRADSLNSFTLLALIIDMSLKFGLPSVVEFALDVDNDSTKYLNISLSAPDMFSGSSSAGLPVTFKADALAAINEALSLKISIQEFTEFFDNLTKQNMEIIDKYSADTFGNITPEVTATHWRELLSEANVPSDAIIVSIPKQVLQKKIGDILKRENLKWALVSVLLGSSLKLASAMVLEGNASVPRLLACQRRAKDLSPFLILDKIEYTSTRSHDESILAAYDIIASAVLRKATLGMQDGDVYKLKSLLTKMRVLLPSHIVPSGLSIPTMTKDYAHASLVTHAYMSRVRRHLMLNLSIPEDSLRDFKRKRVTITGNSITVPTSVYNAIPTTNVTEPLVLMPTVGVYLADALWNFVFTNEWTEATKAALQSYRKCLEKTSQAADRMAFPAAVAQPGDQRRGGKKRTLELDCRHNGCVERNACAVVLPNFCALPFLWRSAQQVRDLRFGRERVHVRLRRFLPVI
ncbi:hypothetical protein HPB48_011751 [Haemaphysalis longicornis]|uniref:Uncharacterized protein n=1 Tax=Haemaphysalis longicornis TaxID=44386 RepID=A0A9J6H1Y9_HAELO|nr:hypothetical protein HPB48_011751 [Haemaphysalis longicornis]